MKSFTEIHNEFHEKIKKIGNEVEDLKQQEEILAGEYAKAIDNEWRTNPKLEALKALMNLTVPAKYKVQYAWNTATKGMGKMHPEVISTNQPHNELCISARGIGYRRCTTTGQYKNVPIAIISSVVSYRSNIEPYIRKSYKKKFNGLMDELTKIDFEKVKNQIKPQVKINFEFIDGNTKRTVVSMNKTGYKSGWHDFYFSDHNNFFHILNHIDEISEKAKELINIYNGGSLSKLLKVLEAFSVSQKIVDNL